MLRKIAVLTSFAVLTLNTLFAQERDYRKERAELARQEKADKRRQRDQERLTYGTNILSIAPFSALDIGVGFGASYEKILGADHTLGIVLPVHLMFDINNEYYYGNYYNNNTYNNAYFYFTPGLKIYPFGQRKVTYAVGPNLMFGAGGGKEWRYDNQGNYYDATVNRLRIGILINNYVNFQFTKSFNLSMQAGLGVRYVDHESVSGNYYGDYSLNHGMDVTGQFTLSLGYRF